MIRLASKKDLEEILTIYEQARSFMRKSGNLNQWNNGHPAKEILEEDILLNRLYIYENNDEIQAVFMFSQEKDPTYAYIEGAWFDESTYGVIHRIASSGKERRVFDKVVEYCLTHNTHLRIDTHEDNVVMQKAIARNGFKRCGIIYLENGDPRIAYERY